MNHMDDCSCRPTDIRNTKNKRKWGKNVLRQGKLLTIIDIIIDFSLTHSHYYSHKCAKSAECETMIVI